MCCFAPRRVLSFASSRFPRHSPCASSSRISERNRSTECGARKWSSNTTWSRADAEGQVPRQDGFPPGMQRIHSLHFSFHQHDMSRPPPLTTARPSTLRRSVLAQRHLPQMPLGLTPVAETLGCNNIESPSDSQPVHSLSKPSRGPTLGASDVNLHPSHHQW
jgi:hypothetical protein